MKIQIFLVGIPRSSDTSLTINVTAINSNPGGLDDGTNCLVFLLPWEEDSRLLM
jgi:hypothetical protein